MHSVRMQVPHYMDHFRVSGEVDVQREAQGDKVNSHVVHQLFEYCASVLNSFCCDLSGKFWPNSAILESVAFHVFKPTDN